MKQISKDTLATLFGNTGAVLFFASILGVGVIWIWTFDIVWSFRLMSIPAAISIILVCIALAIEN